jgi:hypothetical protein
MLIEWIIKEEQVKVITITLKEANYEDDQKTDGGTVYKQILIDAKLQNGERSQKTELAGRNTLRRRRSSLDCLCHRRKKKKIT